MFINYNLFLKRLRKFWTHLDQLICTYDEIKMCKIRLCLKENDANGSPRKKSKVDNILKQLSPVLESDIEARFLLEGHEVCYFFFLQNLIYLFAYCNASFLIK